MPKPSKGPRLGSSPSHQRLMVSGLAAALIRDERIQTTESKAKKMRPVVERLVTLGKEGTIHSRRKALSMVTDRDVIHKLFDDIAPRFTDRTGGYTRILKLGPRKGDAAPMALIEFVEEGVTQTETAEEEPKKRGRRRRRRRKSEDKAPAETAKEDPEATSDEPDDDEDEAPAKASEDSAEPSEEEDTSKADTAGEAASGEASPEAKADPADDQPDDEADQDSPPVESDDEDSK